MGVRVYRSSLKRIARDPELASLMIRLAACANDISNAYALLDLARNKQDGASLVVAHRSLRALLGDTHLRRNIQTYAWRVLMGHVREGVKMIAEVERTQRENAELAGYLGRMADPEADAYTALKKLWDDDSQEKLEFERLVKAVRDNVSFHYSDADGHVMAAVNRLASDLGCGEVSVIDTGDLYSCRFPIADEVMLDVVGDLWGVQASHQAQVQEQVDCMLAQTNTLCNQYLRFAARLCCRYFWSHPAL